MTMTPATHAYIGTATCGCVRAVIADMPDLIKDTAKTVYECLLEGLTVTRVAVEQVGSLMPRRCPHQTKPRPTTPPSLYAVHHFVRSYVLAEDEEDAEEIMDNYLIERIADGPIEVFVQPNPHLDVEELETRPWAREGESRTCREILADAEQQARQLPLAIE